MKHVGETKIKTVFSEYIYRSNCIFSYSLMLKIQLLDLLDFYLFIQQILTSGSTYICTSRWKTKQRQRSHSPSDSSAGRVLGLFGGFRHDHIVNKHYKQ